MDGQVELEVPLAPKRSPKQSWNHRFRVYGLGFRALFEGE